MSSSPARRRAVRGALVLAALVATAMAWDAVRYEVLPKRLRTVEEGFLYRSGYLSNRQLERVLDTHSIDRVVSLVRFQDWKPVHVAEKATLEERGIPWTVVNLNGNGTGDPELYVIALVQIAQARAAGEQILVHCSSGVRRVAGTMALHRVLVNGDDPNRVFDEELDLFVGPFGLWGPRSACESPILPYLNENLPGIAQRLVEEGVLNAVPDPMPRFTPDCAVSG